MEFEDKKLDCTVENDAVEEKDATITDEEKEKKHVEKSDERNEKSIKDVFKKPTLLIGPRRGKVGQVRVINISNLKETPECLEQLENSQPLESSSCEDNIKNSTPEKITEPAHEKQQAPLNYKEPSWGGQPEVEYKMEVLKCGVILHTIDMHERSYHVIGRLSTCDISLAHPTISRYHAILQYRSISDDKHSKGFYVYDLGSTHGTFWNGCRIRPNTYVKLQGGHMIKFGCSQRKFILQAPPEDTEEESELSLTELKEKRRLELLERERIEHERKEREEEMERLRIEKEEQEGIDWGMGEDADEETDLTENPYAITNNEELFLDDPKKTLRGWFEREGHELQYQTEEKGIGQFLCWVDLPLDTATGRSVRAEALIKGKKKESVIQCALEACRILDRHGVLRQATHEARKRKTRNWEEEDFYDSDEDNFLDRTGTVEKKREQRMRQAGKLEAKVETYASLLEKHSVVTKKIADIESRLSYSQKQKSAATENTNEDALDAFMLSLNSTILNKAEVTKMKLELQSLRKDEERLLKLVNITKPANLPSLSSNVPDESEKSNSDKLNSKISKRRSMDNFNNGPFKKSSSTARKSCGEKEIRESDLDEKVTKNEKNRSMELTESVPLIKNQTTNAESLTADDTINPEKESSISDVANSSNADNTEKNESDSAKKKKRNIRRMQQRAGKTPKEIQKSYEDEAYRDDYSMWLPPQNQSGDGKTNLNDKYGY